MGIDKIKDKISLENILEGLCKRYYTTSETARIIYADILRTTAERYEKMFGHKYKRVFTEIKQEDIKPIKFVNDEQETPLPEVHYR